MSNDIDDREKTRPCRQVTRDMARAIHELSHRGWLQCRIAAEFEINQGRVSDVLSGKLHPEALSPRPPTLF